MTSKIILSDGNVPEIAAHVGDIVRVSGSLNGSTPSPENAVEMVGPLSGITLTRDKVIVYMESGQTTTFQRSLGVDMEILTTFE